MSENTLGEGMTTGTTQPAQQEEYPFRLHDASCNETGIIGEDPQRENLPWESITGTEKIERLRNIIQGEQENRSRLRQEIEILRRILSNHDHTDRGMLVPPDFYPASPSIGGSNGCEGNPGGVWF